MSPVFHDQPGSMASGVIAASWRYLYIMDTAEVAEIVDRPTRWIDAGLRKI